ncbi:DNA-binding transcriptional regulator, GntR family [Devosia enhydra]|uniref:DNA-binding transcriptional regulator, GntR family n=2 Tax=Devosia enhydra TaxID=665118 RepID=A0A1K2I284_9HYPH|nr:DNA-binding transcriptional regulator, GntR family [Devosia enhydra]
MGAGLGWGIDNPGYVAFFDALIDGRLRLGQTVKQEELAEILGLSLSPMRETTTLLEAEGLITVRRRVGLTIFYPDVRFVGNTFQFREMLEREGLRRFAQTVTPQWISTRREEHRDIIDYVRAHPVRATYREPVKEVEHRFHISFIEAFDNDQISIIYKRLTQKMFILRLLTPESVGPANTILSMREHMAVIDALEARDVEGAVRGLETHVRNVLHRVLTT